MASSSKGTSSTSSVSGPELLKGVVKQVEAKTKLWDPFKSPDFDDQSYSSDAIVRIKRFQLILIVLIYNLIWFDLPSEVPSSAQLCFLADYIL